MSSKPTVGHVIGDLILVIDGHDIPLGPISIPLVAEMIAVHHGAIAASLTADLKRIRSALATIFSDGTSS